MSADTHNKLLTPNWKACACAYLVTRKMMEEAMAVKTGDKNHEITTGVKPLR